MAYAQQTWTDGSSSTPLTGARLAHIEAGIGVVDDAVTGLAGDVATKATQSYATSRAVAMSIIFGS